MELAKACDGLPLAIKVAAASIDQNPFLDIDGFIESLADVGNENATTEDWEIKVMQRLRLSLNHLSENKRTQWSMLAIFGSIFHLSALEVLWQIKSPQNILHDFLMRHLVMIMKDITPAGESITNYRLHDILRKVALELLHEIPKDKVDHSRRQLNNFFVSLLKSLHALAVSHSKIDLRDQYFLINQYMDSIQLGIEFAYKDQEFESAEVLVAYALDECLSDRMPVDERLKLVEKALEILKNWENEQPELVIKYRQKLLIEKGLLFRALSEYESAEASFKEGLELSIQHEDKTNQAAFWGNLGSLYLSQSNRTEQALLAFRNSLKLVNKDTPKRERSALMNNTGNAHLRLGNLKAAKDAYWISQSLDEEMGDQAGIATSKGNLANIAVFEGDYELAKKLAQEAADVEAELGLRQSQAVSLQIAGKASFLAGEFDNAKQSFSEALQIHEAQGYVISATKARVNLATVEYQLNRIDEAYQMAKNAIKIAHSQGHIHEAAGAMRTLSMVFLEKNRKISAYKTAKCTLRLHSETHSRAEMIEDLFAIVRIFQEDHKPEVANKYLEKAEEWTSQHGHQHHKDMCKKLRDQLS